MNSSKSIRLLVSFLLHVVLFALLTAVLPARYEEIDDILMMMAGSGFYSGNPDSHWLYIHPLWSMMVTFLYELSTNFDWYSLSFLLVYIICCSWIYYELLKKLSWISGTLIYLIWLSVFILPILINLQFTTTSAVAAAASLFGLVASANQRKYILLSSVLIFVSVLIRHQMLIIYAFAALPFLLYHLASYRNFKSTLGLSIPLFVGALTFLSFFFVQQNDQAWKSFYSFSLARNKMVDNIGFLTTDKKTFDLEKINYTATDLKLLQSFITEYPEHQNINSIHYLSSKIQASPSANLPYALRSAGLNFLNLFFLLSVVFFVLLSSKLRMNIPVFLAILFMFCGFAFIVFSGNFLKLRVVNAGLLMIGTLALAVNFQNELRNGKWLLIILTGVALVVVGLKINSLQKNFNRNKIEQLAFSERVEWLKNQNTTLTDVGYSMKINQIKPFNNFIHSNEYRNLPYYNLSWYGGSPLQLSARKKVGIQNFSDLWLTKNALFVMDTMSYKPDLFVDLALQKDHTILSIDTLKQFDNSTFVYQFKVK